MRAVAQHEYGLVAAVFKPVMNAFFFEQAAKKVQVALPILHTIFAFFARRGDTPLYRWRRRVALEEFIDDFLDAFTLENPAVAAQTEKPQPRPQFDAVFCIAPKTPFVLGNR